MSFTGNEDHSISIDDASALTARYRGQMGTDDKLGGFFGKEAIESLLDQDGCVGIRYYYGLNDEDEQVLVLVGTDVAQNDILRGDEEIICEMSLQCPPYCGASNDLNS